MLRIRRSVQATYNTQVNFMASQMLKVSGSATGTGEQLWPSVGLPGLGASGSPLPSMPQAGNASRAGASGPGRGAPGGTQADAGT